MEIVFQVEASRRMSSGFQPTLRFRSYYTNRLIELALQLRPLPFSGAQTDSAILVT